MIDRKEIPFMLSLLSDESSSVREKVVSSFCEFGSDLYQYLHENKHGLNEDGLYYLFKQITEYVIKNPQENTLGSFKRGDKVEHLNYGYYGLIVDIDYFCFADKDWYENNNTQPDKLQPWYHVLVDGSSMVTYSAQSNLKAAEESQHIQHPYITHFFDHNDEGMYIRNDKPWPREF